MKTLIKSLLITPLLALGVFAQDLPSLTILASGGQQHSRDNNLQIPEGYKVTVLAMSIKDGVDAPSFIQEPDPHNHSYVEFSANDYSIVFTEQELNFLPTLIGPVNISVKDQGNDGAKVIVNLKIEKIEETKHIPTNTVVIPTDSSGTTSIVLESSADLVNWVSATPGKYGSSDPKRFFRVRAVTNN